MTPEDAERYLLSRELFGMRFGLDRMRRLMTALGHPELRFKSIHVVGTNGKSSTVRMIAAILAKHGLRTGAYLSPHLVSFAERIRVDDADLEPGEFAAAIQRAAHAAELVDRSLVGDDRVTQFELLTAAAYSELARQGVEVAVIEAGLGGRYDATNVIPSRVQVLTSVGLEHTRWLGPTITAIASEKLDVVQPGGTLVLGYGLHPDALAGRRAGGCRTRGHDRPRRRGSRGAADRARQLSAAQLRPRAGRGRGVPRRARPGRGRGGRRRDPRARAVCRRSAKQPLTLLDGAHNPDGIAALAEALAEPWAAGHDRVVAVISILDDKDAAGMLSQLLPLCDALVLTASQNPRALPPPTLQSLASQLGGPAVRDHPRPARRARARARELAGPNGVVVATGSIYLVADLLRPGRRRPRLDAVSSGSAGSHGRRGGEATAISDDGRRSWRSSSRS